MPAQADSSWGHPRSWLPEAVLAIAAGWVACIASRTTTGPITSEDEATYILLARGLYHGQGFASTWWPGSPPHGHYPPGFPALIALSWKLFGEGTPIAQGATVAASLLSVVLAYALMRRLADRVGALSGAALLACSPLFWRFSGDVLSEAWSQVMILMALLAGEIWRERGGGVGWAACSLTAGLCALSIRIANTPLLLAFPIAALWPGSSMSLRRRICGAAAAGLVLACSFGAWTWWRHRSVSEEGAVYGRALLARELRDLDQPSATVVDLATRVRHSVRTYATEFTDDLFHHFGKLGPAEWPARALALGMLVWGGVQLLRRGRVLTMAWAAGHTLLILLYSVFEGGRFVYPLLPVLILCAWEALRSLGGKKRGTYVAAAAFALLCASALRVTLAIALHAPEQDPAMERYLDVARGIQASSQPGEVVVCRKPCILALETGLHAVPYPFTRRLDPHVARIRETHATWVLVDELSPTTQEFLVPILPQLPFRLERRVDSGGTYALRVEAGPPR